MIINILLIFLCLATSTHNLRVHGMQSPLQEDLKLERQLKRINKLPVKSIHTKYGHIVDCIDINKQPAFDHPLLENHKLQRKPSFQLTTTAKKSVNDSKAIPIIGLEKESCPRGTVPIRRTTKEELIRAKALLNARIMTQDSPGSHAAGVYLKQIPDDPYHGVVGTNSVWNLKIDKDQMTASHLWVQNGQGDSTNKIMVGWHVSPQLHGDDKTYVYSIWTSDNFKKTGCYNLQCSGFVQKDSAVYLGAPVDKTSVYGGTMQEITVSLIQDLQTKNWWLNMQNKAIGYFPAELFPNMASADQVGWGGRTTTSVGKPSPPMGSAYLPDGNFVHACYFIHVAFQTSSGTNYGPGGDIATEFTDNKDCFGAKYYGNLNKEAGYSLQFGGPGGICGD